MLSKGIRKRLLITFRKHPPWIVHNRTSTVKWTRRVSVCKSIIIGVTTSIIIQSKLYTNTGTTLVYVHLVHFFSRTNSIPQIETKKNIYIFTKRKKKKSNRRTFWKHPELLRAEDTGREDSVVADDTVIQFVVSCTWEQTQSIISFFFFSYRLDRFSFLLMLNIIHVFLLNFIIVKASTR